MNKLDWIKYSRANNPNPSRLPDTVTRKGLIFGWSYEHRAERRVHPFGHPSYRVGSWVYVMVPLCDAAGQE